MHGKFFHVAVITKWVSNPIQTNGSHGVLLAVITYNNKKPQFFLSFIFFFAFLVTLYHLLCLSRHVRLGIRPVPFTTIFIFIHLLTQKRTDENYN